MDNMAADIPEYCQVLEIAAADGSIKKLIFPKALDLNRPKRPRTTFSKEQLIILKREFDRNPYLIGQERKELAKKLELTETQAKFYGIFFITNEIIFILGKTLNQNGMSRTVP
uniref:Homeobox domain-containing protein n=1 Tax=Panagrolaimus superbus TaxID=310955 RepID=A0A914YZN9_9BILA